MNYTHSQPTYATAGDIEPVYGPATFFALGYEMSRGRDNGYQRLTSRLFIAYQSRVYSRDDTREGSSEMTPAPGDESTDSFHRNTYESILENRAWFQSLIDYPMGDQLSDQTEGSGVYHHSKIISDAQAFYDAFALAAKAYNPSPAVGSFAPLAYQHAEIEYLWYAPRFDTPEKR